MNKRLVLWSITVGLGGFLFGLGVAVISGTEQAIQKLWGLSDWLHGTAIAMALYGTAFGAALGICGPGCPGIPLLCNQCARNNHLWFLRLYDGIAAVLCLEDDA